ncbi:MAG: mechanosensitive ion channel family protein [Bryobacteraceae bacterium]
MSRMGYGIKFFGMILVLWTVSWGQTPPDSAPVVVGGHALFNIQTSLGPFSAQARAAAIKVRLTSLTKDLTASLDSITAVVGEASTDVVIGDRVLLTITDADAAAAGKTRGELVADRIMIVKAAATALRNEYSTRSLVTGSIFTVLISTAFIILLILLARLRSVAIVRLQRVEIRPLRLQKVDLMSSGQIKAGIIQMVKAIRLLLVLIAFYVYVPLVLGFFPWTREYAPRLVEFMVVPLRSAGHAILDYLPRLVVVLICAAGAYFLIRISHFLFRELGRGRIAWPGFYPEWAAPTHKILRLLILAVTLVVVFPYLPGSGSPAFQGISIFLGVLLSLGSTSAIANIIGGVILTYTRAFHVGDRVKIADTVGDVVEKSLLATRIRTIKNEFITVPNSMVLGSHIINFSASDIGAPLILHSSITIGYDAPWRQVQDLLVAAALRTSLVIKEPAPFVLQTSLDDFYVTYQINAYTREPARMAMTYAELHQNIQDCFNEAGVEIMSPHYGSLRDGNLTTIPANHLPKDYSAPSFRFQRSRDEPRFDESEAR